MIQTVPSPQLSFHRRASPSHRSDYQRVFELLDRMYSVISSGVSRGIFKSPQGVNLDLVVGQVLDTYRDIPSEETIARKTLDQLRDRHVLDTYIRRYFDVHESLA